LDNVHRSTLGKRKGGAGYGRRLFCVVFS